MIVLTKSMLEESYEPDEGIVRHAEGIGLMPDNIELSAIEVLPVNTISWETVLRSYINTVKTSTIMLIDCMSFLGINDQEHTPIWDF